jgi:hypothetical protein
MKAVAIRTAQARQKGPEKFHDIATVECDKCDEEYVICHKRELKSSPIIAEVQAAELKVILSEDHRPQDTSKREIPISLNLNESARVGLVNLRSWQKSRLGTSSFIAAWR